MKIESIIQRKGGTVVELDGTEYHFKPEKNGGPHVADVKAEHAERLLSIPEGYRKASDKDTPPAAPPADTNSSAQERQQEQEAKAQEQSEQEQRVGNDEPPALAPARRPGRPKKAQ